MPRHGERHDHRYRRHAEPYLGRHGKCHDAVRRHAERPAANATASGSVLGRLCNSDYGTVTSTTIDAGGTQVVFGTGLRCMTINTGGAQYDVGSTTSTTASAAAWPKGGSGPGRHRRRHHDQQRGSEGVFPPAVSSTAPLHSPAAANSPSIRAPPSARRRSPG